jgi:hypothetical protein
MGQSPCFFGLSELAQASSEPRPSAPQGGQHLWPGKAGSTVFLSKDTAWLHP